MGFIDRYTLKYPSQSAKYPATTFGAAGAYDAIYLLAYASFLSSEPVTGQSLAMGLTKLSNPSGLLVNTGAPGLTAGLSELQANGSGR